MKELLIYFLQSAMCLSFFAVVYMLFLRRSTFFLFNRFFLLIGLLTSFVLPFVEVKYDIIIPYVEPTLSFVPSDQLLEFTPVASSFWDVDIWMLLGGIYILGMIAILLRNLFLWHKLNKYKKTSRISIVQGCQLIEHSKVKTPFSVFTNIYLSDRDIQNVERDIIINHELKHINQKHWLDLLCSECALMLQWFNPLMWYYIYLQKENHEYLADESVLADGASMAVYRAVLINQRFQGPIFSFSNAFNFSNQKNRLNMMKREKTSPWKKIAALAVLPLCGAFIALSATPNYVMEEPATVFSTIEVENANVDAVATNVYKATLKDTSTVVIRFVPPVKKNPNQKNFFSVAEIRKDTEGIKENPLIYIDDKESSIENFEKTNTYDIESLTIYRVGGEAIKKYGDKGKDGVISITTKGYKKADGKTPPPPVKAAKKEGVGSNKPSKVTANSSVRVEDNSQVADDDLEDAIYVIDNQLSAAKSLAQISKDNIESISILKKPESLRDQLELYYPVLAKQSIEKGVIIVKTKEGAILDGIKPNIYLLLNGKEVSRDDVGKVDPKDIKNIDVFKPGNAKLLEYGDKAKDGAILITTM